jgi:hypothetical protein
MTTHYEKVNRLWHAKNATYKRYVAAIGKRGEKAAEKKFQIARRRYEKCAYSNR